MKPQEVTIVYILPLSFVLCPLPLALCYNKLIFSSLLITSEIGQIAMLSLKITNDTFAKLSTKQASSLSESQKLFVDVGIQGKDLKIKSYVKQGDHLLVKLKEPLGTLGKSVFFFSKHVQVEEIRGVWITNIDSDIFDSKDNIKKGLEKLKGSGFNTLYPVVWNKGFTFFKSSIIDNTVDSDETKLSSFNLQKELAGRDILAEIIEVNQELGNPFRIIPWLEYGLMVSPNAPLTTAKPDWFMTANNGDGIVNGDLWLNPTHPEVQNFFAVLISELVKNYEIDGIQLDDHFGIPNLTKDGSLVSMGFDDFTVNLFKQDNPGAANPISSPRSEKFKTWRKDKVTELLSLIFHTVKSIKNDCIISVSPNPLAFSVDNFLADWKAWEQEGIAEEIVLQIYRPSLFDFNGEITKIEVEAARNHIPTVIGILTGLNPTEKRVSLDLIKKQTQAIRDRDFAGFSYFFYGSLFDLGADGDTPESRKIAFDTRLGNFEEFYESN